MDLPNDTNRRNLEGLQFEIFEIRITSPDSQTMLKSYSFQRYVNYAPKPPIIVASDFKYADFRKSLDKDLHIPLDATLYSPPNSGVVNVDSKRTALIALTQIQGSDNIGGIAGTKDTPILNLTHRPTPKPSTPQDKGKGKPQSVLDKVQKKPSDNDIQPTTPVRPTHKRPKNTTIDSPGTISEDESEVAPKIPDDDYDDGLGNDNNVMKAFDYDWSSVSEEDWKNCCIFFSCDLDAPKIRVTGIKVDIEPYQAFAIYRILVQAKERRSSFILGDDTAFGKTGIVLAAATLFHVIHNAYKEASLEWRQGNSTRMKHLREGAPLSSICPTQKGRVQCPCQQNSFSRQLIMTAVDYPSLIVTLPGHIPAWLAEAKKWIDVSEDSPAFDVVVKVSHHTFKNRADTQHIDEKSAMELRPYLPINERDPPNGDGSQNIVLMSDRGVSQFLSYFEAGDAVTDTNESEYYRMCASFVFFDEFPSYKGSKTSPTAPFKMLQKLNLNSAGTKKECPLLAVGISSSARADFANFRPFVHHALTQGDTRIPGLESEIEFDKYEKIWENLVKTLNLPTRNDTRERENLLGFLRKFIPHIMISRRRGDKFRGSVILGKSPIQLIPCDTRSESCMQAFDKLISQVKKFVNQEYNLKLNEWLLGKKEGKKPNKRAIAQARLEFVSGGSRRRASSTVPQILLRSSTFPALAQVVHEHTPVDYSLLLGSAMIELATRISRILSPKKLSDDSKVNAMKEMDDSYWWERKNKLFQSSPKVQEIHRRLHELLDLAEKQTDDPSQEDIGPPPKDGTNIRHLLVFTDYPLSAFLILMVLLPRFIERNVVFLYVHSGVDINERQEIVNYMQKDCSPGDPVKVLISTMRIIGRGYNIFRANTVIITEVPRNTNLRDEAFGRIDRRGQVMQVNLIQLYDRNNLAEEIRRVHNHNRDQLTSQIQDNTTQYPLASLILGKEVEKLDKQGDKDDDPFIDKPPTEKHQGAESGQDTGLVTGRGEITGYGNTEDSETEAKAAFPTGSYRRFLTPGENDHCGAFAIIGSIMRQFSRADVPIPTLDDLITCILLGQQENNEDAGAIITADQRNFTPDQLDRGLKQWVVYKGYDIDVRLGYIHEGEARCESGVSWPGRRLFTVWVHLTSDSSTIERGHYEAIEKI
ncbi:hypothetical protein F4808DRAFT_459773 [Astrocystis sublimbata]|nr:hypothetical protein F4808DRAFT_459773 [Astrocystis sublimbata]